MVFGLGVCCFCGVICVSVSFWVVVCLMSVLVVRLILEGVVLLICLVMDGFPGGFMTNTKDLLLEWGMLGVSFVLVPWFLVELGFVGSDMIGSLGALILCFGLLCGMMVSWVVV